MDCGDFVKGFFESFSSNFRQKLKKQGNLAVILTESGRGLAIRADFLVGRGAIARVAV